jgi:DNA-binding NtrC family response regulator
MRKKTILVVDDEKLIRWTLHQKFAEWNYDVVEAETGQAGLVRAEEEPPDLVLLDVKLPDVKGTDLLEEFKKRWPSLPVIMITAFGEIEDVVDAMRRGAYNFLTKPIDLAKLQGLLENALEAYDLKQEVAYFREKESRYFHPSQIVARSKVMLQVMDMIQKIAESEASIILLQGETGTGKDLFAQTIHYLSRRKDAPFQAINCSAIPENLLESELFGYERGAFTDAKQQKKGLVELADEGTLFLDEIGSLGLPLQAKLLRFLETHSFKRLGGLKDIEVDLRVVAATNHDLAQLSREGKFRTDLIYRLNVCPVILPPLRERIEDILPLAQHFISLFNKKFGKQIEGLEKEAEQIFLDYSWPGNVRELKNAVERAMIFEDKPYISAKYLPIQIEKTPLPLSDMGKISFPGEGSSLEELEKDFIIQALKKAGGNQSRAAKLLKISRDTLRYRVKKLKISLS